MRGRINLTATAAVVAAAMLVAGCGGGGEPTTAPAPGQARAARLPGLRLTEPPGWHRVAMRGIVGANHMLTIASFPPQGGLESICAPRAVVQQIPAGAALVQFIVRRPGPPGLSRTASADHFARPRHPFDLGRARPYECGESFNLSFREGNEVVQLRVWTKPGGPSAAVRREIEQMVDSLRPAAA